MHTPVTVWQNSGYRLATFAYANPPKLTLRFRLRNCVLAFYKFALSWSRRKIASACQLGKLLTKPPGKRLFVNVSMQARCRKTQPASEYVPLSRQRRNPTLRGVEQTDDSQEQRQHGDRRRQHNRRGRCRNRAYRH